MSGTQRPKVSDKRRNLDKKGNISRNMGFLDRHFGNHSDFEIVGAPLSEKRGVRSDKVSELKITLHLQMVIQTMKLLHSISLLSRLQPKAALEEKENRVSLEKIIFPQQNKLCDLNCL
ncbi:hypothetical protein CDAR_177931 [Caerostris darwini]|uniref:Uncharacterized protein n=1 Tax=Caerostris darwini TaxID=1538125 RepID=A0AAV4WGQ4_9ARAC|nr:hypothetical protein CDAR_177931 [Caerostris darwini]